MLVSKAKALFSNAFCGSELLSLKICTGSSTPINKAHAAIIEVNINVDNIWNKKEGGA
jgi:hypothetical protein